MVMLESRRGDNALWVNHLVWMVTQLNHDLLRLELFRKKYRWKHVEYRKKNYENSNLLKYISNIIYYRGGQSKVMLFCEPFLFLLIKD